MKLAARAELDDNLILPARALVTVEDRAAQGGDGLSAWAAARRVLRSAARGGSQTVPGRGDSAGRTGDPGVPFAACAFRQAINASQFACQALTSASGVG